MLKLSLLVLRSACCVMFCLTTLTYAASSPRLLVDLIQTKPDNPSYVSGYREAMGPMVTMGSRLIFLDSTLDQGVEPWVYDMATSQALILRDINPGPGSSYPSQLTLVGSVLFFEASDDEHGAELWKTDWTPSGTMMVKDIRPGVASSGIFHLTECEGTLFFMANDGEHGNELWLSDGTATGTRLVRDISEGFRSGCCEMAWAPTAMDGKIYFPAVHLTKGIEIHKSDGTMAGTQMFRDINTGQWPCFDFSQNSPVVFNHNLYFAAIDPVAGNELFKSDGTSAGTALLADIQPGTTSNHWSSPRMLAVTDTHVYFSAYRSNTDQNLLRTLWQTDGTVQGTRQVCDSDGQAFNTSQVSPSMCTNLGSRYFGQSFYNYYRWPMVSTDGTQESTSLLQFPQDGLAKYLCTAGDYLYCSIDKNKVYRIIDGRHIQQLTPNLDVCGMTMMSNAKLVAKDAQGLWSLEGDQSGLTMFYPLSNATSVGLDSSGPYQPIVGQDCVYCYQAMEHTLYKIPKKNPENYSKVILPLPVWITFARIYDIVVYNEKAFFILDDGENDPQLWVSDGTQEGTHIFKDFAPQILTTTEELFSTPWSLYITTKDTQARTSIWESDGTEQGTVAVLSNQPNFFSSIAQIEKLGSKLVFRTYSIPQIRVLNPTTGDFFCINQPSYLDTRLLSSLLPYENKLLFITESEIRPYRALYQTDATTDTAQLLFTLPSTTSQMLPCADRIFFASGSQLWVLRDDLSGYDEVRDFAQDGAETIEIHSFGKAIAIIGSKPSFYDMSQFLTIPPDTLYWLFEGTQASITRADWLSAYEQFFTEAWQPEFVFSGNSYYFFKDDPIWGREVWVQEIPTTNAAGPNWGLY